MAKTRLKCFNFSLAQHSPTTLKKFTSYLRFNFNFSENKYGLNLNQNGHFKIALFYLLGKNLI